MAVEEKKLEAAARSSVREKGEQKDERLLLACSMAELRKVTSAGFLAEKRKSEISGKWRRPKQIP